MRKLIVFAALIFGLVSAPVMAAEITTSPEYTVDKVSSTYSGRKDKAYWTRVWYEKQARKGRFYKNWKYGKKRSSKRSKRYTKRSKRRTSGFPGFSRSTDSKMRRASP